MDCVCCVLPQGANASALEKEIGPEQFPVNEHYFGLVNVRHVPRDINSGFIWSMDESQYESSNESQNFIRKIGNGTNADGPDTLALRKDRFIPGFSNETHKP